MLPSYVAGESERPRADRGLLEVAGVVRGQDDGVVVRGRHQIREVHESAVEVEAHSLRIDLLDACGAQDAGEVREGGGAGLGVGERLEGGYHVVGAEGLAVGHQRKNY